MSAAVAIEGDLAVVRFSTYDLDSYSLFLRVKTLPESVVQYDHVTDRYTVTTPARFAPLLGVQASKAPVERLPLPAHLFDYQRHCISAALDAKRFACWADTGLGKGLVICEWCRQVAHLTGGRVLVLEPLQVIPQLIEEARRFYGDGLPIRRLDSREALAAWCVDGAGLAITNPEKFIPGVMPELRHLAGLAFDECFVAGTPVDTPDGPVAIEDLRPGDQVLNATGIDNVVNTAQRTAKRYVIVQTENRQGIINSEHHPYLTRRGWVDAAELQEGDELVTQSEAVRVLRSARAVENKNDAFLQSVLCSEMAGTATERAQCAGPLERNGHRPYAPLCLVWGDDDAGGCRYAFLQPIVCSEVGNGAARGEGAGGRTTAPDQCATAQGATDAAVPSLWVDLRSQLQTADETVLFSQLQRSVAYGAAGDQGKGTQSRGSDEARSEHQCLVRLRQSRGGGSESAVCRAQSDDRPDDACEGRGDFARDGASSTLERRQGARTDGPSAHAVGGVGRNGVALRIRAASTSPSCRPTHLLLSGHCQPGNEGRHRGGRLYPQDTGLEGTGSAQGSVPAFARVDRVEVLEQDDPRLAPYRAPDGKVYLYDLEVAQHPSFSVRGLLVHNSSLLKTGGGVIKWNLIKSARGIEYKLSCTATPAPNDTMEYASQASFLEKLRSEGEILWTFFTKDKFDNWHVKPHAKKAFYRFMSSWSIYLRNPAHFGWQDILATLPEPELREYDVPITDEQSVDLYRILGEYGKGMLADDRLGVQERSKLSQVAKGFVYEHTGKKRTARRIPSLKPAKVAELAQADVADGRQVLVWTVFDEESVIVAEQLADIAGVATLDGSMPEGKRTDVLERFRHGDVSVLISKAALLGYGMNFQFCRSMVFSGFDDSAERFYQAVRRCYRFGQTETVRVHIPYVRELEGLMWGNVQQKLRRFDEETAAQEEEYRKVMVMGMGTVA